MDSKKPSAWATYVAKQWLKAGGGLDLEAFADFAWNDSRHQNTIAQALLDDEKSMLVEGLFNASAKAAAQEAEIERLRAEVDRLRRSAEGGK